MKPHSATNHWIQARIIWRQFLGIAALIAWITPLAAQAPAGGVAQEGKGLVFSGSFRTRTEIWDWFETPLADGSYAFQGSLLRMSLARQTGDMEWQVEAAVPLLLGVPHDAIAPPPQGQLGTGASYYLSNHGQTASVFLKQGFIRFKNLFGDKASSLRVGRFEFADGAEVTPSDPNLAAVKRERIAQRLIGNFTFTHVGRSFDGLTYVRNTARTNFTFMGSRVTRGAYHLDGMPELDVDLFYGALTRSFGKSRGGEARIFALQYHDGRNLLKSDNRPLAVRSADHRNIRITTIGGHYLQAFPLGRGKSDLLIWGALQTGRWGTDDHWAGALAVEAGYQFSKAPWQPWFRGGILSSSGDGNPLDKQHRTFFQAVPTARAYARFPFYNLMNNQDLFAELLLRPHPAWTLRSDLRALRLSAPQDLWYSGAGAYQQDIFGYTGRTSFALKNLASVLDLSADYRWNARVNLSFYVGQAFGGDVVKKIYPQGSNGTFAYVELLWRF